MRFENRRLPLICMFQCFGIITIIQLWLSMDVSQIAAKVYMHEELSLCSVGGSENL
jgi:hypothetical protein